MIGHLHHGVAGAQRSGGTTIGDYGGDSGHVFSAAALDNFGRYGLA
jgi:hypothetical protein